MFFFIQHLVAMQPAARANVSHMNQFQCLWVQLNASAINLALPMATAVLIMLQNAVSEKDPRQLWHAYTEPLGDLHVTTHICRL